MSLQGRSQENESRQLKNEIERLEESLKEVIEVLKEKKKEALAIAEALYLQCSYAVFKAAEAAAEEYRKYLVGLKAVHEMILRIKDYLAALNVRLEDLDSDMDQVRYDLASLQREITGKTEEKNSIEEQLKLTDYEKCRSDEVISDRRMKILDKITDDRLIPVVRQIKKYRTAGYQEKLYINSRL